MNYRVDLRPKPQRVIRSLRDAALAARLIAALRALAALPRPPGCKKLRGEEKLWRIRVGDFRIVYEIHDQILVILVVAISHRRDAYR